MRRFRDWPMNHVPRGMAILFACGLVAIVADALLFNYVTTTVAGSMHELIAIRDQLDRLDAAHDALVDAEAATRGLLLAGGAENIQSYNAANARAKATLDSLKVLPRTDPNLRAQADEFDRLARSRLDELARVADAYRAGTRDRALDSLAGDKVKMDQLGNLLRAQQTYLERRRDA